MVDIISTATRSLTNAGDSRRVSVVKEWLSILGFDDAENVETAVLYTEKHGFFFGAWLEDEQPDLEDLDEEELKNLSEKVDVLDAEN